VPVGPRVCLCFAALLAAGGCVPEVSFDVTVDGETTIEQGTLLEELLAQFGFASLVTMDLSDSREFANNDVRKDQVTGTRLTLLRLETTAPDGAVIDFIDAISFSAEAPGVDTAVVATKNVPDGATKFDCDLADVELAPFVRAESMSLTTDVTGRRPDVDTTVKATATFAIKARVVGP
jgi:hypothetical protein